MNWLLSQVPASFVIGAVAGPLAMFVFQFLKKAGGLIDARPAWEKKAYLFVMCQVSALLATFLSAPVSCDATMTATACLALYSPAVIKGLIVQAGAMVSFKLKKMKPTP